MKNILKLFFYSLIAGAVVVAGAYIAALTGLSNPYGIIDQFFESFGITYTYDFNSFGEMFRLWSAAALFPATSQLVLTSPSMVGSLIPLGVFTVLCFITGYLYKIPNGISVSIIVFLWTTIIAVVAAAIVPHALPAIGLSPADYEFVRGLADELILFTMLAPPNMLAGTVLTLGVGIGAAIFGGIFHRLPLSGLSSKIPKKTKKTKSTKSSTKSKKSVKRTIKKKK